MRVRPRHRMPSRRFRGAFGHPDQVHVGVGTVRCRAAAACPPAQATPQGSSASPPPAGPAGPSLGGPAPTGPPGWKPAPRARFDPALGLAGQLGVVPLPLQAVGRQEHAGRRHLDVRRGVRVHHDPAQFVHRPGRRVARGVPAVAQRGPDEPWQRLDPCVRGRPAHCEPPPPGGSRSGRRAARPRGPSCTARRPAAGPCVLRPRFVLANASSPTCWSGLPSGPIVHRAQDGMSADVIIPVGGRAASPKSSGKTGSERGILEPSVQKWSGRGSGDRPGGWRGRRGSAWR